MADVERALGMRVGDPGPLLNEKPDFAMRLVRPFVGVETRESIVDRLRKIPGVAAASVAFVGGANPREAALFVGISGVAPAPERMAPTGKAQLPVSVASLYAQHALAFGEAMQRQAPDFDDDETEGYALFNDAAMHALEDQAIAWDRSNDLGTVRLVLRTAEDPAQRRAAAWLITYGPDKKAATADLLAAAGDPDDEVRNISVRALALIAAYGSRHPEAGIAVDVKPFVERLHSLTWTDRNKATAVLIALTADRNPAVVGLLRRNAMPELTEMARWQDSHYEDALLVLGHMTSLSDAEIEAAMKLSAAERERVIRLAGGQ